jgi:putative transposase
MPKPHFAAPELAALLDGSSAGELIPELARHGLQQLIELEVAAFLGADRHERTVERLGYHNGYWTRTLTTQVGDLDLLIPKLRTGSFLPSIFEPRRRVDQALYAVIMEAYIHGLSARKVDALVSALGPQSGISKSQVSRICQEFDAQMQAFLSRPLESSGYAYHYKERFLSDVKLVVSNAHICLTKAIGRQLQGCVWQRCPALGVRPGRRCGYPQPLG